MQMHILTTALALAGTAMSLPTAQEQQQPATTKATRTVEVAKRGAASIIEAIMPSSTSCSGRGDECTTAEVAGPYLADSMSYYEISSGIAQAGILSLVAYESNELQYRKNLDQSAQLGRGTVNEQSGEFNVAYAESLGYSGQTTSTVLQLVSNDTFNFYSGAWYYSSQDACSTARSMADGDADEWFNEYMSNCDGMGSSWNSSEPERWEYWSRAKEAFGLA